MIEKGEMAGTLGEHDHRTPENKGKKIKHSQTCTMGFREADFNGLKGSGMLKRACRGDLGATGCNL